MTPAFAQARRGAQLWHLVVFDPLAAAGWRALCGRHLAPGALRATLRDAGASPLCADCCEAALRRPLRAPQRPLAGPGGLQGHLAAPAGRGGSP